MTEQESYTILGKLLGGGYGWVCPKDNEGNDYYQIIPALGNAPDGTVNEIKWFLQGLPFTYDFVDKLLDEHNDIYFKDWEHLLGESAYIVINLDTGQVGIWCNPMGDIAWLDRYKKDWWLKEDIENN